MNKGVVFYKKRGEGAGEAVMCMCVRVDVNDLIKWIGIDLIKIYKDELID